MKPHGPDGSRSLSCPLWPLPFEHILCPGFSCGRLLRQFSLAVNGRSGGSAEIFPAQPWAEALDFSSAGRAWMPQHSLTPRTVRKIRKGKNGFGPSSKLVRVPCSSGASRVEFLLEANWLPDG